MVEGRLTTLIAAKEIAARIEVLGQEIRAHYGDKTIVLVAVMRGSFMFLADLARAISGPVEIGFLGVSSYKGTNSTGNVRITHDLGDEIAGAHVLLVEDIVDTGLTISFIRELLEVRKPASLQLVTFLDKPVNRTVNIPVEFVGFVVSDHFVVGYGLDLDQRYRNLPYLAIYHPDGVAGN
jgi:hypoxanthine phosphoribosyltransferase